MKAIFAVGSSHGREPICGPGRYRFAKSIVRLRDFASIINVLGDGPKKAVSALDTGINRSNETNDTDTTLKGKAVNKLEPLWYELSPYVYFVTGIIAIFKFDGMAKIFGILLLTAAATMIGMRKSYREIHERKKHSRTR